MPPIDFLVIGAGRAGSTWVWRLLRQHTECYVPARKELNYFSREALDPRTGTNPDYDRSIEWYHHFFANACRGQIRGEVSPSYLWSLSAPARIKGYNPTIKLLAVLRDPVERSHSHFLYRVQRGALPAISFEDALERDPFILHRSLYGRHLQRYFDLFPREQIKILMYDQLREDPRRFALALEEHLGIGPFVPDSEQPVNPSGAARHPGLSRLARSLNFFLERHPRLGDTLEPLRRGSIYRFLRSKRREIVPFSDPPAIAEETEHRLREYFHDDIGALEGLLQIDLNHWKA